MGRSLMHALPDSPIRQAIAELQQLLADQPACGRGEACRARREAIERIIGRLRLAARGEADFCDVRLPLRT